MGPVYCRHNFLKTLPGVLVLLLAGIASASGLEVLRSDRSGVHLSLTGVSLQWREIQTEDGKTVLFEPRIKGMGNDVEPGLVSVPATGGWLVVPPGTMPRVVVKQEGWQSAGNRPLMVAPVPVLVQGDQSDFVSMSEILVLPGQDVPEDAAIPTVIRKQLLENGRLSKASSGPALELGDVLWWRGHRIVAWRLNMIKHDGRVASQSLNSGKWEILFETDSKANSHVTRGHDVKFSNKKDDQFGGNFLNGELLSSLSTEAQYRGLPQPSMDKNTQRGLKSGTLLGNMEGRISIKQTRLYRVTYSRLQSLGYLPETPIAESEMRLYQRRYLDRLDDGSGQAPYVEIEVPIKMFGEGDNFDGDDFFIFYGLRMRDDVNFQADVGQGLEEIYGCGDNYEMLNEGNYYWVSASSPDQEQEWARMESQSLPAASSSPVENYRRVDHYEESVAYRPNLLYEDEDRVFLNHRKVIDVSATFNPLWNPDPNGSASEISYEVAGFTHVIQNLHAELITDNTLVTSLETFNTHKDTMFTQSVGFDPSAINGSSTKFVLTNTGTGYLNTFLNWVRLSYDAKFEVVGNSLAFNGGTDSALQSLEVTGFSNSNIGLVEVTDPRHPVFVDLSQNNILVDGDSWKLSLDVDQSSGT